MTHLFRHFSAPHGIGSHCTPQLPGSIHEGGELGQPVARVWGGLRQSRPDRRRDGRGRRGRNRRAGRLAIGQVPEPARDGAVLPILHLNGYKIANPALLARIPPAELQAFFEGHGYRPCFVAGDDPPAMHRKMAALGQCVAEIRAIQARARGGGPARIRWPMIVLRTPKGWTGPRRFDGHAVENSWRSHQVPLADPAGRPQELQALEAWLRAYQPETLFDQEGLAAGLRTLAPTGARAQPACRWRALRRPLACRAGRIQPAGRRARRRRRVAHAGAGPICGVMRANPDRFRLFGPDETASNRLEAVYEASGKAWMVQRLEGDADGGHLARTGASWKSSASRRCKAGSKATR